MKKFITTILILTTLNVNAQLISPKIDTWDTKQIVLNEALKEVVKNEGGASNSKKDYAARNPKNGQWAHHTNRGIQAHVFKHWKNYKKVKVNMSKYYGHDAVALPDKYVLGVLEYFYDVGNISKISDPVKQLVILLEFWAGGHKAISYYSNRLIQKPSFVLNDRLASKIDTTDLDDLFKLKKQRYVRIGGPNLKGWIIRFNETKNSILDFNDYLTQKNDTSKTIIPLHPDSNQIESIKVPGFELWGSFKYR